MNDQPLEPWSTHAAAELYGVHEWSAGFFDVSKDGHLTAVSGGGGADHCHDLMAIVQRLRGQGVTPPILLRFSDILAARVAAINETFRSVMISAGYRGNYRGVFPIKVNQQRQVVQEIAEFGRPYHHGFEVGSKAELVAAMACLRDEEACLVCNGYKDEAFIRLALCAQKLGLRTYLVIEMASELRMILGCAEELGVQPQLGIRAKLASRPGGLWDESGGDRSSFGLTASETVRVVDALKTAGYLHCLRMLHYHLGSQIPHIRGIRSGIREAARFYVDLVKEGAPMGVLDVGGGLAVDYDGSQTDRENSSNYGMREYCSDIVEAVMAVTDEASVPHPVIVSESGRATVAYHAVLVFNILDTSSGSDDSPAPALEDDASHETVEQLKAVLRRVGPDSLQESFHDATYYRDEVRSLFMHGQVTLRERAQAEEVFWAIAQRVALLGRTLKHVPQEIRNLAQPTGDVYYGNFSVFQSIPDVWAIDQLFPIVPLSRLDERPTCQATLADITCDCDGKIDRFVALHGVNSVLPLHQLKGAEYYLGVFLVGAYQKTLGDLHNLLGATSVVAVRSAEDGGFVLTPEIQGDTVGEVLSCAEYVPGELTARVREAAEQGVRLNRLTVSERDVIVDTYEAGVRGYTYFERD
ncbi:MAG: biosynthetic arginine decarboxylase [Lentisphaerae bacterium]|jgi:arginine decarboxylase|nr:biosynthetic arginine decarboxylase [Lentisphaerota bacterium]MBT4820849.1 biosynthetic arginine decarboxylase [Lentisphaerota bacterium]MBT5611401.1 biosynthetic arginine decarboxylase [Lentisphaerota bacterium]MBT7059629.1 biosynthetic arginine decarboxylase [Lentisphaerota bacterium]MBT7846858.1 biosynthetic arginine decarboxylase [Lentisphaerota bacterium]